MVVVMSTWTHMDHWEERDAVRSGGFNDCVNRIGPGSDLTFEFCQSTWREEFWMPGWDQWWGLVLLWTIAVVISYVLIWLAVAVVRWVWRGRKA